MILDKRIDSLVKLGNAIRDFDTETFDKLAESARNENLWFTTESVEKSLTGISRFLERDNLIEWTNRYDLKKVSPKKVGLIMAGNIPLVGFHDFLSTLISGHHAILKLSSKDSKLLGLLINELLEIAPAFGNYITVQEEFLKNYDAVIATGSDNSSKHFEYYFRKYPNVIRKNRTSCAILTGDETPEELSLLGNDIFSYFGLGCRNVSKLFLPIGYDFNILLNKWDTHKSVIHHHKYANNYDYQKSILLVNLLPFLDNGFVLLQENEKLVSPISVLYYEYYNNEGALKDQLQSHHQKIQCVVGKTELATVRFGQAQFPEVWDYADGVDTLKFLSSLN